MCHLCPPQAPPSAPRELSSTALSAEGRLQLSWSPPLVTGGRSDLTYNVVCEHCDGGSCVPCGEKIRFEPGPTDLRETTVVVTDLDSHLNYTFTVEAHSGVSQFGTERVTASITTALDYTGELIHISPFFFFLWFNLVFCSNRLYFLIVWGPTAPNDQIFLWFDCIKNQYLSIERGKPFPLPQAEFMHVVKMKKAQKRS